MATKRQVAVALKQAFPDVDLHALEQTPAKDVMGFIVSCAFDKLDHFQRQQLIRRALRKAISLNDLGNVGPIAAMTPAEADLRTSSVEV